MRSERPTHARIMEAMIFAAGRPVEAARRSRRNCRKAPISKRELASACRASTEYRGIQLDEGRGRAGPSAPQRILADHLAVHRVVRRRLSRAALETLAIIAYHQPVTRAEVEEIRGVHLGRGTLDILLEAGWIAPKGRRRTPGRPVTWVTTPAFMEHFGLESLDDLPGVDELEAVGLLEDAAPQAEGPGAAPAELPSGEAGDAANGAAEPEEGESAQEVSPTVVPLSGRAGQS